MTAINLLEVLDCEPVSGDLERQVIDSLAVIAKYQVYIELMASQAVPELRAQVKEWENQTKALEEKLPEFRNKQYALAELCAREDISAQYLETLRKYDKRVAERVRALPRLIVTDKAYMKKLLPDVYKDLLVLESEV
jgi:hypothetical protein